MIFGLIFELHWRKCSLAKRSWRDKILLATLLISKLRHTTIHIWQSVFVTLAVPKKLSVLIKIVPQWRVRRISNRFQIVQIMNSLLGAAAIAYFRVGHQASKKYPTPKGRFCLSLIKFNY